MRTFRTFIAVLLALSVMFLPRAASMAAPAPQAAAQTAVVDCDHHQHGHASHQKSPPANDHCLALVNCGLCCVTLTGVGVVLRLPTKPSGKPVPDAVIVRTRVDMGPDGMADMVSPVALVHSEKPGVYALKTDLPMAGRYLVSIAAKVQGEPETVVGKVIIKAVKYPFSSRSRRH